MNSSQPEPEIEAKQSLTSLAHQGYSRSEIVGQKRVEKMASKVNTLLEIFLFEG